ncbi:hypothetical protein VP424E501_P0162 [Vibrio phage 424E50-1]|nr:hypothetical protein VP424E501_P0162 [Vibrio phage 424E50-1]
MCIPTQKYLHIYSLVIRVKLSELFLKFKIRGW